jgi:hypothetical protein
MGVPTVEKAPGVHEPFLGMWRYALADMKESGVWAPVLRPMLDEMIECRRLQRFWNGLAEADPVRVNRESGLESAHDGFRLALQYGKRAQDLAAELGLTPKAKKQLALLADEEPPKGNDAFAVADELAQRRVTRA